MKKLVFVALFSAFCMTACNNNSVNTTVGIEDSIFIDTTVVDSTLIDTIIFD